MIDKKLSSVTWMVKCLCIVSIRRGNLIESLKLERINRLKYPTAICHRQVKHLFAIGQRKAINGKVSFLRTTKRPWIMETNQHNNQTSKKKTKTRKSQQFDHPTALAQLTMPNRRSCAKWKRIKYLNISSTIQLYGIECGCTEFNVENKYVRVDCRSLCTTNYSYAPKMYRRRFNSFFFLNSRAMRVLHIHGILK